MISDDGIPPQTVPGSNELQVKRLIQVEPHLNWNFGMDSNFRVLYIGSAFTPEIAAVVFVFAVAVTPVEDIQSSQMRKVKSMPHSPKIPSNLSFLIGKTISFGFS